MYEYGRGVQQSHVKAVRLFLKAANKGCANAQCNLAILYLKGHGVVQSDDEAARWLKKAVEQYIMHMHSTVWLCYLRMAVG